MSKILLIVLFCWSTVLQAASSPPAMSVATAHPLATEAGLAIMKKGGNAFDAAITISAVLAVVEPQGSGIGGGGFWLLHEAKKNRQIMIDGRERAPLTATATLYQDKNGDIIPNASKNGPLAAGIPGMPAALVHLAKHYGQLPLKVTLQPAIDLASNGIAVSQPLYEGLKARRKVMAQYPATKAVFFKDNEVVKAGHILKQPDLANTLRLLADNGWSGFYQGPVAEKLVSAVQQDQGIWTIEDLLSYQVVERAPIVSSFNGHKIVSAAPPSSGGIVLATMLNMVEVLPKVTAHTLVETMKFAYRDRSIWLGDPDYVSMPVQKLMSKALAKSYVDQIQLTAALPSEKLKEEQPKGEDTTHFSVLDKAGNAVSATLSVNYRMGSGFIATGTGVLLNNEMDDFSSKPGHPNLYGLVGSTANEIAPGKRMLSSMTPTLVMSNDGLAIIGTPGGSRIITMVLHAVLSYVNGDPVEQWVARPRFHHQYLPDQIQMEPGAFSEEEILSLEQKGHKIKDIGRQYGNMQVIFWDKLKHKVMAASDPRGIGSAKVELVRAD